MSVANANWPPLGHNLAGITATGKDVKSNDGPVVWRSAVDIQVLCANWVLARDSDCACVNNFNFFHIRNFSASFGSVWRRSRNWAEG